MEAVIFIGIQASGKSTYYKERFFDSHVRISLDLLRTRHREKLLLEMCLTGKQPFVVDNTNPTKVERSTYIEPARAHGFRVTGYYFASQAEACKQRNQLRSGDKAVPLAGLLGTYKRLELPTQDEGFTALHYVTIDVDGQFLVSEWQHEV
jgi:predicted kinase